MVIKLNDSKIWDFKLKLFRPKKLLPPKRRTGGALWSLARKHKGAHNLKSLGSLGRQYYGSQNSIVKVSYLGNKHPNQWKVHGHYLARESAQKNLEKGLGFNGQAQDLDLAQTLKLWQQAGDPRIWKVIISPEEGPGLI